MLLEFMRGRDVGCPLCGYNLRDLTKATCPECNHRLELRVGVQKVQVLWLILAIIPGAFSGLCAAALLTMIIIVRVFLEPGQGGPAPGLIGLDVFGWLSGAVALVLILARNRFLAARRPTQRILAMVIWAVHIAAFLVLMYAALA
jgi:hypothetical protein